MSKHTPAPWFVRETGDHYSKRNDIYVIGNPDGSLGGDRKLAMLIDTWAGKQTIHNARLIAAAPENYACNIELAKIVRELCGIYGHPLPEASLERSDAAINKATGE